MFDRIIGYQKEKRELEMLCDMIKNREKYRAFDVNMPRGLIIYGVHGVGKTLMATALIEEAGIKSYMLRRDTGETDFVSKINSAFTEAKANVPAVILLDDLDKFASDELPHGAEELSAVQSGIDSLKGTDVFVVATATDLYPLPKSLLRAGMLERVMRIRVPDRGEAADIIRHYIKDKKISSDISAEAIAHILDGESCEKLKSVLNEAGMYAAFEGTEEISRRHIVQAVLYLATSSDGSAGKVSDEARHEIAFHEAGHAVAAYSFDKDCLGVISLSTPFGEVVGITQVLQDRDYFYSHRLMRERVIAILAGRAAVELKFGRVDVGAASDLERALHIVQRFVREYASEGLRYLLPESKRCISSEGIKGEVAEKSNSVLEELYKDTKTLLIQNWSRVELLAAELIRRGTLLYDEVESLFEVNG